MKLPTGYEERAKLSCPFCGKEVSAGHVDDVVPIGFHANPVCLYWTKADNIVQYMMLAGLKMKSDDGQLERN